MKLTKLQVQFMRIRTCLMAAALAATATVGGVGMSTSAQAAETGRTAPASAAAAPTAGVWIYYGWYWTNASCNDAGLALLRANPSQFDSWECRDNQGPGQLFVHLYLHRR